MQNVFDAVLETHDCRNLDAFSETFKYFFNWDAPIAVYKKEDVYNEYEWLAIPQKKLCSF